MLKKIEKSKKHRSVKKIGQIPGSVIYTGEKHDQKLFIEAFEYTKDYCRIQELDKVDTCFDFEESSVAWINVNGLNHVKTIEKIGAHYKLHPLVIEDIVSVSQRPKIDEHEDYVFVVLKMLYYDKTENIVSEQVSFILGKDYVLTFQEAEGDVFDEVRDRIKNNRGRVRSLQADYLLYVLIDAIVDHYFNIIETLGNKIEDFETKIFSGEITSDVSQNIQNLKREILKVRRAIFPLREVINRIEKHESALIDKNTITYYRDIYDHLIQVTENIDVYREMIWGLMDMYMTTINNKMNEIMKVLTIMASIFIPLTFIAGIYGMNFDYMPELRFKYSYFILWGIMIGICYGMLKYFKQKKWL